MRKLSDYASEKVKKDYPHGVGAADKVFEEGGSPRAQIDAARKATGDRLTYNAHDGERQRQRNLERLAKKYLPCPICHGVESCDHSLSERKEKWK